MSAERERGLVELVAPDGSPVGSATVADAHTPPGRLHRAFSVLLFDGEGRTLIQQRAPSKTRFPLRWANACCGHPEPGEAVTIAARRRLAEELGVENVDLAEAGVYVYEAADPATGRVEQEYDHVVVGLVKADLRLGPDPDEVLRTKWLSVDRLDASSLDYAPWFRGVLNVASGSTFLPDLQ